MKIQFLQAFGAYLAGAIADLPEQVANNLKRAGAAQDPVLQEPYVSKTEVYKPIRHVKSMNKAL